MYVYVIFTVNTSNLYFSYCLCLVPYNWWKDVILAAVFISCVIFAGMAWRERKISQIKVDELMELMKIAEDELAELQDKMSVPNFNCCSGI